MERRKQGRGWHDHFLGFWARLNCEEMPVVPARLVRRNLDDPRKIPYLLIWRRESDGQIMEAVRLSRYHDPQDSSAAENYIEFKRPDGDYEFRGEKLYGHRAVNQGVITADHVARSPCADSFADLVTTDLQDSSSSVAPRTPAQLRSPPSAITLR